MEDEPDIRSMVGKVLEEDGHDVGLACNGADALDKVRVATPDCVLLDLNMPVMGGAAFLAAWRAESWYAKVPVVLFTNAPDAVTIAAALEVQAFVSKPFDVDDLADTISRVVATSVIGRRERLTERVDEVVHTGMASCRDAVLATVRARVAYLRQRAYSTEQAIARSQHTIVSAGDCLDRIFAPTGGRSPSGARRA